MFEDSKGFSLSAPVDYHQVAYFIMFYLGVGNLFPWNAFITASTYYAERFCGTSFEDTFENYFSLTYTLSQTIGLALAILFQDRLTLKQKISYPLLLYAVIFGVTTMLVGIVDIDPNVLFYITLFSAFLSGIVGALLSGGLFSLGAMLPSQYTGALMNGQGLAGLIVSGAAVLTTAATERTDSCTDDDGANADDDCAQSVSYSALAYFLIATLILFSCVFAFKSLLKMSFTRHYINKAVGDVAETTNPLIEPESTATTIRPFSSDHIQDVNMEDTMSETHSIIGIGDVYRQVLIPSLSVWATFAVTIGLFPSLTVFIESTEKCKSDNRFFNDLFIPFLFLLFNIFDLAGRITAGSSTPIFNKDNIWIASAARIVFFPLFMLCNVSDSKLPVVFNHDAFPIIFMILMAFTNGYVASNCMMMGAGAVDSKDSSLAGTIMIFSLTAGLLTGACISFLTVYINEGSV